MEVYEERMAVAFLAGDMADTAVFRVYKFPAADLKRAVDVARSATWAEMTREKMIEEGRGGHFAQRSVRNAPQHWISRTCQRLPRSIATSVIR